ncbi:SgrR family transcriptional regulator [Photobacterium sp. 1_MG-2023]|uniref:SgrR family transcriptional regulator n=1 Tax=Photobacterium sp. 1_MG-2023 TaxID=3062646 RepID=UPI0026E3095D|nr:SgrR family transcriptional regulator [Photobacterium sp. 1_MG-2023]MDO6706563.1 SgrR family transcriptional regulator [Photobacterium sp. 1_MG-2023]
MRYWRALIFLRDELTVGERQRLSLDHLAGVLSCTRRNAQIVIKKLVEEGWIRWQPGVGRGNLPTICLLKPVDSTIRQAALSLLAQNQIERATALLPAQERQGLLAEYLAQHRSGHVALLTPAQHHQDVLRIPFYRGIHDLDAVQLSRRTEVHLGSYIYAGLLQRDVRSGCIEGDLAAHWERRGNDWLITLRKGLMFHDGSPLTATEVKAHFERLKASDSANVRLFDCIERVDVLSPLCLKLVTQATPDFVPALLTQKAAGISKVTPDGRVLGAGAFRLDESTEWLTRLTAFEHYHGYRPWLDAVEIWNIGDRAMDFDLSSDVVHPWLVPEKTAPFSQLEAWELGCEYVLLNENWSEWMRAPAHRLRLSAFLRQLPLPESMALSDYRVAKGMLKSQAPEQSECPPVDLFGLPAPERPLVVLTYQLHDHIALAESLTAALNAAGIAATCCIDTFPDFNRAERLAEADIIISGEVFGEDSVLSWMEWLKASTALNVCLSTRHQKVLHQKLETVFQFESEAERLEAFGEVERWLVESGLYRPLWQNRQQLGIRPHLNGVSLLANGWIDFSRVVFSSPERSPEFHCENGSDHPDC